MRMCETYILYNAVYQGFLNQHYLIQVFTILFQLDRELFI